MVIWIKKEVGKTWEICHENLSTYCLIYNHVAIKNVLGVKGPLNKILITAQHDTLFF